MTSYAAFQMNEEFKVAVAHTGSDSNEVRIARALFSVEAIESFPANVSLALSAAAMIAEQGITASQVTRNYPIGGTTHNWINKVVSAAERVYA